MLLSNLVSAFVLVAAAAQAPAPCEADPYRQFDFWLGTWDVYTDDQLAGRNVITREEGGCLILETWTSASGITGQSYNFYDPASDHWRQVWVSNGLLIDYSGGPEGENTMALEGTLTSLGSAATTPFRGRWELMGDGSVQQTFWTYDREADAWTTWFDGNYRRAPDE